MTPQDRNGRRTRLVVDVSPELRRRVKLAAAGKDVSVREYVVSILEDAVPELPEQGSGRRPTVPRGAARRLGRVRGEIMQGRRFEDDSADLIEEARAERTAEL